MNNLWEIKIEKKPEDEVRLTASPTDKFISEVGKKAHELHRLLVQHEEESILRSIPIGSLEKLRKSINKVYKERKK